LCKTSLEKEILYLNGTLLVKKCLVNIIILIFLYMYIVLFKVPKALHSYTVKGGPH
jgi:hypothetical protein